MKKILLIISACHVLLVAYTQQLPQYSQFFLNKSVYNPGAIATEKGDAWSAKISNRLQWVGINDAPRTIIFNVNGPVFNNKMGLGADVFVDATGPTRRTGASISYSYKLKLSHSLNIGIGVRAGILEYSIDGSQIQLQSSNDPSISDQIQTTVVPDVGIGLHLYSNNYYIGISAPQILGNQIQFFDNYKNTQSALARHLFAYAGYRIHVGSDFIVEPAVLAKYASPVPIDFEGNIRVIYKDIAWLGASYRLNDAVVPLVGFTINSNLIFSYSFDIPISNIVTVTSGSHELTVILRFKK